MDEINNNKLNENDLQAISGGITVEKGKGKGIKINKLADVVMKSFQRIKTNCAVCGKEIEIIDTPIAMLPSSIEYMRYNYYRNLCHECALKKPFRGDKVVDGKIVYEDPYNIIKFREISKNNTK